AFDRPLTTIALRFFVVVFVTLMSVVSIPAAEKSADKNTYSRELHERANRAMDAYRGRLDELAAWCEGEGLSSQAAKTKGWARPRAADKLYITALTDRVGPPGPENAREWQKRFWKLRREQAEVLFKIAHQAARQNRPSLAFDLLMAAVHEDPDHEVARRILGYQKFRGRWHTLFEIRKLRADWVDSEKFGWIRKADLQRYEKGERRYANRWISTEEDARLHKDIRKGWDIQTEHYSIRTNHGIEAGVALGRRLEQLHNVWKRLFIRYYATREQVLGMFEGKRRGRPVKLPRHKVVYFRDRDDYNAALGETFPNIGISTGVYVEQTRRAYFFAGEGSSDRTILHEATHQLFHESRPVANNVGQKANFWIVEGIATYMESLRKEDGNNGDGQFVLGGFDDIRMKAARYRLLKDDFYVPLAEFCGYGMRQIQADPRIATLYSQMAGLTNFLVYYDGGRYRDALVAYLRAVYNGSQNRAMLFELTGTPPETLDRQYREFMLDFQSRSD
ncbi:MAG: DUF1570 domain-containing protein, partial [Planctomycetota bacterium]|nr:DUF1570 domain-containing protein [Planctomycetota bacterium]